YAALTQPSPLSLKEIQQQVIDSDTLLLEYALGDEKSYLWAVTTSSIQSYELPPRKTIETATRRLYQLLTERNQQIKFEKPDQQHLRVAKADADYVSTSTVLSQMLLRPIALQLGKKRLLIIGEGALNYLPFAALPEPTKQPTSPLIVDHEIVTLPSASTLAVLRREVVGRTTTPKTLAVIADPVFEKDDERVKGIRAGRPNNLLKNRSVEEQRIVSLAKVDLSRSAPQSQSDEVKEIHRLPFTRREAEEILALVPETDRLKALDFDASRAIATNPVLGQYSYVHFATHGFLNTAHPELSGLVLSLVNR